MGAVRLLKRGRYCLFCGRLIPRSANYPKRRYCCVSHHAKEQGAVRKLLRSSPYVIQREFAR